MLKCSENSRLEELNNYCSSSSYCNGNNMLFISGGENNDINVNKFWKIDLKIAEIQSINMSHKKNHSMIALPGNYVFIVGGQTKETFYYDLNINNFYEWKKLNIFRIEPALILVNNYLYCFNNINYNINDEITFEKTDLNSDEHKWELIKPIMPSKKRFKNTLVLCGMIMI